LAKLSVLFGPEHGIVGNTPDGEVVDHSVDKNYRVPVYSLYGKTHKPTKEMLEGIDVLVCDIQEVGARFYTFISTIALAMEAAAESGVSFVVLDRPNPIRGLTFDGPVREQSLRTFVAWMPLPVSHGMTIGELARMWNGERQLAGGVEAKLEVVPMAGWKRSMWFDETGLEWIPPSPNMQRLSTAVVYPGICFLEGTSASEGRGTESPFEIVGAPWMKSPEMLKYFRDHPVPGITFTPTKFVPRAIAGTASKPKFEDTVCNGIRLAVTDRNTVEPVKLGLTVVAALKEIHPHEMELRHRRFDILTGSQSVRQQLEQHVEPSVIWEGWAEALAEFGRVRQRYLMYD
jgi:uncharacterized protein YbbC (DUF1343 family)